jgi:hypothetical protein
MTNRRRIEALERRSMATVTSEPELPSEWYDAFFRIGRVLDLDRIPKFVAALESLRVAADRCDEWTAECEDALDRVCRAASEAEGLPASM